MKDRVIMWFRRDLRLQDNPALAWAVARNAEILPVYIHSPGDEAPWEPGAASRWWLHHSLEALRADLGEHGLHLACYTGGAAEVLSRLARAAAVKTVVANRLYDPHLAERDERAAATLAGAGVELRMFDSGLLFTPGSIRNQQGDPYRVFTPFWRKARRELELAPPQVAPGMDGRAVCGSPEASPGVAVAALGLLDAVPWHTGLHAHWIPGERAAGQRLDAFIDTDLADYETARDIPASRGSSRLSPYLHFGEISPARILARLQPVLAGAGGGNSAAVERFLSELGWREFAHHVLWHFPHAASRSLNPRYSDTFWLPDNDDSAAWRRGETGIPLVDAGMRELWETGWMHNRVRMIVGSFLTKNLGIHWLSGARWFWDTLVDADLANNSMGWQWVAGCGVDAAPYYRIFNPETQARRFDPGGEYIRRWLGDDRAIEPIVDLALSRQQALARYRDMPRPDRETP